MNNLDGQHILLLGACGTLGSHVADALAAAGADLFLSDCRLPALEQLSDHLAATHKCAPTILPFDLWRAPYDAYDDLHQALAKQLPYLDALIDCAAYFEGLTPLSNVPAEVWLQSLHINLTAPFWMTQACLDALKAAPQGRIIYGIHQLEGLAYRHAYGIAEAGKQRLIQTLALELEDNYRVHVLGIDSSSFDSRISRLAFPDGQAQWHEVQEIVPRYLEALTVSDRRFHGRILGFRPEDDRQA